MLTEYTDYASIKAVLGVSDEDIGDETLALTLYSDFLAQELEDIHVDLPSTYVTMKALATPSLLQTRFLRACNLFATFAVARQLTAALPLFAAKDVTDGKAAIGRFDNPYKDVIKSVNEQYGTMRTRLVAAMASIGTSGSASVAPVYVSVVSPAYDPVTGT